MFSATSKVFTSNCRLLTVTLRVSCGCFCSIRLCGARGFSKLRSLMYWPWIVSGPACGWPGVAASAVRPPRPHAASAAELAAHAEFLKKLSDPMWLKAEVAP